MKTLLGLLLALALAGCAPSLEDREEFDAALAPSDEEILTKVPQPRNYTDDMGQTNPDTLAYTSVVAARDPNLAGPIPAATILKLMRKNRREFSPVVEGGAANRAPLLGVPMPFNTGSFGGKYFGKTSLDYTFVALEPRDAYHDGGFRSCGDAEAAHWSDLQFNYYCQIPPIFRLCKTALLFALSKGGDSRGNWGTISQREATTKLCLEGVSALAAIGKTEPDLARLEPAYKDIIDHYGPLFKKLHESQWETLPSGARVNMLDYLMSTQTFAFDYQAQQDLLNTFYGEVKPTASGPFDPANPTDCATYRPDRPKVDAKDGSRCLATTLKLVPISAIGR